MTDPNTPAPQNEESLNEETGKPFPQVMLDPSLLLTSRSLRRVTDALIGAQPGSVTVPSSFWRAFRARELPQQMATFFGATREALESAQFVQAVAALPSLVPYALVERTDQSGRLSSDLAHLVSDELIVQTLMEEWEFLNRHSWLVSRIKRPFATFVRAGAVAIEGGRHVLDRAMARTLKKSDQDIPNGLAPHDRLRAACKWLAVGGTSATVFVNPAVLAALLTFSANCFFLFDP